MKTKGKNSQTDLYSYQERTQALAGRQTALDKLNATVDWERFRPTLKNRLGYGDQGKGGRPPYDEVLMLKIIVLQKYHDLSEEETEFQILDRHSFQRFLGLDVHDDVPDKNTIWTFKERLGEAGVRELFDVFEQHLQEHGLIGRQGKIVDASFVEVPRQRNRREENEQIKHGEVPESFQKNPRRRCQKDLEARWTKKGETTYYGYKNHIKVDAVTKMIASYAVTDAAVHDSQVIEELVEEGDGDIFADSAYSGKPVEEALKKKKLGNYIHEKGTRAWPLTKAQKSLNRLKSGIRARAEHIFGQLVYVMEADYIRSIGLKRARFGIGLGNLVYNLNRYAWLSL